MNRLFFLAIILIFISGSTLAQDTTEVNVQIIHSNTLEAERYEDGLLKKLRGDVEVQIDSTLFLSQWLNIYKDEDIKAKENIVIKQGDSLFVYSDSLDYVGLKDSAILEGEVVLDDRGRKFFTTELIYFVDKQIAVYDTFGLLTDEDAQFTSYYGEYHVKSDSAFFRDTVELIHPDVEMKTDSMWYDTRRNIAYFLGPTILKQGDALIYCEGGYYNLDKRQAFLKYNVQYREGDKTITADSMRYVGRENEFVLLGDPHYHTPEVDAVAEKMTYNDSTKIASLYRNVKVVTSEETIKGDTIIYNTVTENYDSKGKTHVVAGNRIIDAQNAFFDAENEMNVLRNEVVVRDTAEGFGILGREVRYQDSSEYIETADGRPLVYFLSEDKSDTTFLSADTLISKRIFSDSLPVDTGRLVKAFYDVKILSKDYQAICDSLVYNSLDSVVQFYYSPVLWSDTMQLKGDTITATLTEGGLKNMNIRENAIIILHETANLYSQISGTEMQAEFEGGDLDYVDFISNVQSIYYIKDENNAYTGVAEATSASLRMRFNEGELEGITYYRQPDGTMHPMTINHNNMRLPNFEWLEEKRPTTLDDLDPVFRNGLRWRLGEGSR